MFIGESHVGACGNHGLNDGAANAAAATGDETGFSLKFFHLKALWLTNATV
jgi:hypothetical protein